MGEIYIRTIFTEPSASCLTCCSPLSLLLCSSSSISRFSSACLLSTFKSMTTAAADSSLLFSRFSQPEQTKLVDFKLRARWRGALYTGGGGHVIHLLYSPEHSQNYPAQNIEISNDRKQFSCEIPTAPKLQGGKTDTSLFLARFWFHLQCRSVTCQVTRLEHFIADFDHIMKKPYNLYFELFPLYDM